MDQPQLGSEQRTQQLQQQGWSSAEIEEEPCAGSPTTSPDGASAHADPQADLRPGTPFKPPHMPRDGSGAETRDCVAPDGPSAPRHPSPSPFACSGRNVDLVSKSHLPFATSAAVAGHRTCPVQASPRPHPDTQTAGKASLLHLARRCCCMAPYKEPSAQQACNTAPRSRDAAQLHSNSATPVPAVEAPQPSKLPSLHNPCHNSSQTDNAAASVYAVLRDPHAAPRTAAAQLTNRLHDSPAPAPPALAAVGHGTPSPPEQHGAGAQDEQQKQPPPAPATEPPARLHVTLALEQMMRHKGLFKHWDIKPLEQDGSVYTVSLANGNCRYDFQLKADAPDTGSAKASLDAPPSAQEAEVPALSAQQVPRGEACMRAAAAVAARAQHYLAQARVEAELQEVCGSPEADYALQEASRLRRLSSTGSRDRSLHGGHDSNRESGGYSARSLGRRSSGTSVESLNLMQLRQRAERPLEMYSHQLSGELSPEDKAGQRHTYCTAPRQPSPQLSPGASRGAGGGGKLRTSLSTVVETADAHAARRRSSSRAARSISSLLMMTDMKSFSER